MNAKTLKACEQLVANRSRVKAVFPWDGGLLNLACAGIFTARGRNVDESLLASCKTLLKERTGAWSYFRSTARSPLAALLAVGGNPRQTLENALAAYQLLKKDFWASAYLPLAAMTIAQSETAHRFAAVCTRTRAIYQRMKKEHPFLTSSQDSVLCALMALSEKSDDALLEEAERCYRILKGRFFSAGAVQSLSHVLALGDGGAEEKCRRTMALFEKLRAAGKRYGTDYELPTLGVLALTESAPDDIAAEIGEIDDWLARQSGFGFWSSITKRQRLMYAGILAQREFMDEKTLDAAAVGGTISIILAQQAAIAASIAASSAASSASSSH